MNPSPPEHHGASRHGARGRPPGKAAESHAAILDAVYDLLQEQTVSSVTMEAIARRAGVGKPTLYKWWPNKAALVLAMYREKIVTAIPAPVAGESAESAIRTAVCALIRTFQTPLGKIMADLIAEGQSEPETLRRLFDEHIRVRRAVNAADIQRGIDSGELRPDTQAELLIDAIFGALYYRLLFRNAPFDESFGEELVKQVFSGVRRER